MKKTLLLLMFTALAAANLYPQEKVTLTNSTILKMVKAKLSEELIIDEIKNSTTRFNISPDSILFLVSNKVPDAVISEMKIVTGNQQPVSETSITISSTPVAVKPPEKVTTEAKPPEVPEKKKSEEAKNSPLPAGEGILSAEALGYVVPLQSLMKFYEDEFKSLEDLIKGWDAKIRISIDEGNRIREKISNLENELYGKINADSKEFTEEINSLKSRLSEVRESYGTFQNSMVSDGLKMIREIEDFGSKLDRSITDKYSQAGQDMKKTDPDPSSVGGAKAIIITRRKINADVVDYISPMSVILFFYQNEISSLDKTIDLWNEKIAALTLKDKDVIRKLDPLKKELADLQTDQKKNKKPIAELKDRISDLEKERKALEQQMSDDSEDLSRYLALSCKAVQNSLKERIAEIIEEIKYSYQDSFTYKSL